MKVKYVHFSEPDKEKVHDTEIVLKKNRFIKKTQIDFDEFTLRKLKEDKAKGYILSYEILTVTIDGKEYSVDELREGYRVITGLDNDDELTDIEICEYMLSALMESEDNKGERQKKARLFRNDSVHE